MKLKKTIAAVLCMLMLLSCVPFSVGAADSCSCGFTPTIYVTGIASYDLKKNIGTEDETLLFPPTTDTFLESIAPATILNLAAFAATRDWDYISNFFAEYFNKVFADLGCDSSGNPKEGTGIVWEYPTITSHGKGSQYTFIYDWRTDPLDVASQLADFVDYVCKSTGHDKVNIIAFSLGSAVTMSYVHLYGDSKINNICFNSPAYNGVSSAGEPFNMQIEFAPLATVRFIDIFLSDDGNGLMLGSMLEVLNKVGVVGCLTDFLNEMIENCLPRVYNEVLVGTFVTMPSLWALVPDEFYEQARETLLVGKPEYAELLARVDDYHYNVQKNLANDLAELNEGDEHNVGFISKYGMQITPVIKSWNNMSDSVLDTKYSSYGATCAILDGTLGEGYTQAVDCGHNHVSPDNQIDASTCLFPEQTWFVRDLMHMNNPDCVDVLMDYILNSDEQVTVWSNEEFPQFLRYDEQNETLSVLQADDGTPDGFEEQVGNESWWATLYRFIKAFFTFVAQLFKKAG